MGKLAERFVLVSEPEAEPLHVLYFKYFMEVEPI